MCSLIFLYRLVLRYCSLEFGHLIVTHDSILKGLKTIANELSMMKLSKNGNVDDNYIVNDIELPKL
ncbi:hypothetical protein CATMIT_02556 [Catenibacterium mitsuokai DSM 15897]|nr:hypothetical protein CATMIT_02556 [Catenibacterium mitsuokai DSM 15897]